MSTVEITENSLTSIAQDNMRHGDDVRSRELLLNFIELAHEFVRRSNLTHQEWMTGIASLKEVAAWSDDQRNEFILLSDCLGISAMVDLVSDRLCKGATSATGLGPFFLEDQPSFDNDTSYLAL